MDNVVKEPKLNSKQRQYIGEKLHKSSSILSVAAILLTIALFVRIETVARDTKTIDTKFTQKIQQIHDALRETGTQQPREKEGNDIASYCSRYVTSIHWVSSLKSYKFLVQLVVVKSHQSEFGSDYSVMIPGIMVYKLMYKALYKTIDIEFNQL